MTSTTDLRDFSLGSSVCMVAFPFHLILDTELRVRQIGTGFRKLIPTIECGKRFQDFLVEGDSRTELSCREIESRIQTTFHFRCQGHPRVEILGGFYSVDDRHLLFLANPIIQDTKEISTLSLKFADVARHDPLLYYIAALQTREALLRDTRNLVRQLEQLVEKRTEQLRARADELCLTESRLNEAQRMAKIGSFEWDVVQDSVWWSEERYRMAGNCSETFEPSEESFLETVHPDDRSHVAQIMADALAAGGRYSLEYRTVLPDGSVRTLYAEGEVTFDRAGCPVRMFGTTQDITERVELERQIVHAGEHERNRIGRDLHDGLGQELTGISLRVQGLFKELSRERSPHAEAVREVAAMIQNTISETRRIARDLTPGFSVKMGIGSALRALANEIAERFHVTCVIDSTTDEVLREGETAAHLYRIAQESINNAIRHGEAQSIELRLARDGHRFSLEVLDDGVGIPSERDRFEGLGLKSMRYRAGLLRGRLEIGPRTGGGTRVFCSFVHESSETRAYRNPTGDRCNITRSVPTGRALDET